jgi:hypothetical protein
MVSMQDSDPKPSQSSAAEVGDEYRVTETLGLRVPDIVDQERVRRRLAQETPYTLRRRRLVFGGKRPSLPRWPMLSGVFTFPWQRGERLRWLWLSLAIMVPLGYGVGVALGGMAAAFFLASGGVAALAWAACAFSYGVAIVRDTAEGCRRVESWPDGPFIDWISDSLYVFNALFFSALLGLGLLLLAGPLGPAGALAMPLTMLALFPILLLSMFEADSPLMPLSPLVWRSTLDAPLAWLAFYVESAALCVGVGWLLRESILALEWLALVPNAFLLVAAMMIYFRLLGRLGHCCADAARRRDPEEAEEFEER